MVSARMANEPEDPQVAIFRRMTPEQKLRAAERLYWSARELKAAWFRHEHPEWTEAEVEKAVRDAFAWSDFAVVHALQRYRGDRNVEHLRTIGEILQRQGKRIDRRELGSYVAELGLQDEWAEVAAGCPG